MAIEEPRYTVLVSDPPFEVRRYAAFTVAQTQISGDFDAASRNGFRRIASYIFGDNVQTEVGAQRKISMTAPVTVAPESEGWRVHFVMPSAESMQTLPQPLNPQIQLRPVVARGGVGALWWVHHTSEHSGADRTPAGLGQNKEPEAQPHGPSGPLRRSIHLAVEPPQRNSDRPDALKLT